MVILGKRTGVATIELTADELVLLNNALNEVSQGLELPEFSTRIGADREKVLRLIAQIQALLFEIQA